MLNTKAIKDRYEGTARSLAEIAPWMILLRPGMVLNKDGSLLVCYEFAGVDYEGLEPHQVDRYAQMVEQACRAFNEHVTVWFTVDRRRTKAYPSGGHFDDKISEYLDAVWHDAYVASNQFMNRYYVSVQFTPKRGAEGFYDRVSYFIQEGLSIPNAILEASKAQLFRREAFSFSAGMIDVAADEFDRQLRAFRETLDGIGITQLLEEDLLTFLHARISPASHAQRVRRPRYYAYLDGYLVDNTLQVHGHELEFEHIDTTHVTALSIKDWPQATAPGVLDNLLAVAGEITLSQCFKFVAYDAAKTFISSVERHNRTMSVSLLGHIKEAILKEPSSNVDHGRLALADDAASALVSLTAEGRAFGYYNMTVLCYGTNTKEADNVLHEVGKALALMEYVTVRETLHLLSAWAGTIPGQAAEIVRWHFVNVGNLGDVAPVRTMQTGDPINAHLSEQSGKRQPALTVLPTELSTPFNFNYHHGDLGHTFVVGPSGSGKSVFLNFLTAQFRKYSPCNVYIFDKDYSCRIATLLQDGQHLDLVNAEAGTVKLNPVKCIGDAKNWPWLQQWLRGVIQSQGYVMTAEDDVCLWEAIKKVHASGAGLWQLATFASCLDRHLVTQLAAWIGEGKHAKYFDNLEDGFEMGNFSCIEMSGLFQIRDVARQFLDYAFFRINESMDGRPTKIYIEECWFMLEDEHFAARVRDWLKTIRKKNGFVVMVTQSLDDLAGSEIFSSIIDNMPTRIFLPNHNAYAHHHLYSKSFGLNDQQIRRIQEAIPKRNYYIVTPTMSRMVVPRLPKEIVAIVRSDQRAQRAFDKHYATRASNSEWKLDYLEEMTRD